MFNEINQFVNWVRRRNSAAHTWRDYRSDLTQFHTLIGDLPPTQITFHHVDQFVNSQIASGYQAATINRRFSPNTPHLQSDRPFMPRDGAQPDEGDGQAGGCLGDAASA